MKEFFVASPVLAWSLVSVMLALLIISLLWRNVVWWWHNTWYSFPLIGKIARLSKKIEQDSDRSWYTSEALLCRDYKQFVHILDEDDFKEKASYITKAGDGGRKSTPSLIWVLTIALVFVESMGFAYVLAGYTLPGASENLQQTGALGIAFLVSVILVGFTHFAGHELYVSESIRNARQKRFANNLDSNTTTDVIDFTKRQSIDDDKPVYVQLMNRVGETPRYIISIFTAFLVISVAIGATYVRGKVLEKQVHQQTVAQKSDRNPVTDALNLSAINSKQAINLPAEDSVKNRLAVEKAIEDDANIDLEGGWGTFILLALIFIFLQILSVIFGYRWGFAGKYSAEAYKANGAGRFVTYADVRQHYKNIINIAQSKLKELQQKLRQNDAISGTGRGISVTKTFIDFLHEEQSREAENMATERKNATKLRITREVEEFEANQQINYEKNEFLVRKNNVTPKTNLSFAESAISPFDPFENAMKKIREMGDDKEAKISYIKSLPDDLNVKVKQALKEQKEQKDAAAQKGSQRDDELDELLS